MSRRSLVLGVVALVTQLVTRLAAQITVVSAPGPADYAAANASGLTATWLIQNSSSGSGASIAARVFGHGVAQVGANTWFQGYVQSRGPILGGGGLTFSSASFFSGLSPQTPIDLTEPLVTYGTHEAGHTIQFIELSAFGRFAPFAYLGLGGLEVLSEHHWWDNAVGRFWNSNATFMGQGGIW